MCGADFVQNRNSF